MATETTTFDAVPPSIIGHRGACGHAPENTLASIRKAHGLGVRWVEFDIHLSKDGVPVLLHDDTLDRTTNGRGPIDEWTWDDLQHLDAGSWFGPAFAGEHLPDLSSAIALLSELGMGANIEIKPSAMTEEETGRAVVEMLRADWPTELPPPLLSSFKFESLRAAQLAAPEFDRALLVTGLPEDWESQLWALECVALHCAHAPLTPARIGEIISSGYAVRCYTVNEAARAANLLRWGVASVITDFPDRMAGLVTS
jgi:glycerophosphoryl diester phosphodiesterase